MFFVSKEIGRNTNTVFGRTFVFFSTKTVFFFRVCDVYVLFVVGLKKPSA